MDTPLITTIVPTFRRPRLLKRAIGSVLRQSFTNFQVCVYDNASGDGTADVVAEIARRDSRVKYHCHPENIGGGANFNYALARVDTAYFSFLSDDDVLLPEFYETAMAGFHEFPDAGFSAGSTIVMSDNGNVLAVPLDHWPREGCFSPPDGFVQLIENKLPVWTSILFRKAVTDQVGLLDLEIGGPGDFDYQLQVAIRSPFVVSRKPSAIFVSHDESYSAKPSLATFWPGWRKLAGNVSGNSSIPDAVRNRAMAGLVAYIKQTLFSIGLKLIYAGDCEAARQTASILRQEFSERGRSLLLETAARFCKGGGLAGRGFVRAYDLARALRSSLRGERSALQLKYGRYAQWL